MLLLKVWDHPLRSGLDAVTSTGCLSSRLQKGTQESPGRLTGIQSVEKQQHQMDSLSILSAKE